MSDTDKLVAAILAGARFVALNATDEPPAYIAEYEKFLRLLEKSHEPSDASGAGSNLSPWGRLGDANWSPKHPEVRSGGPT